MRSSADPSSELLSHCLQISVEEKLTEINGEPICAKLLFSEKPIRTGHPVGIKFPASLFWRLTFSGQYR